MVKKRKKQSDKKKLTYAIISIFLFFAIVNGSIFIIGSINDINTRNQTIATSDKPAADHLKSLAYDAFIDKKFTQSLALYQTAQRQYEYIVENSTDQAIRDAAQNGIIDCDSIIFQIGIQAN